MLETLRLFIAGRLGGRTNVSRPWPIGERRPWQPFADAREG